MIQRNNRLLLVGRLTLPTCGGNVYREATGTEELAYSRYGVLAVILNQWHFVEPQLGLGWGFIRTNGDFLPRNPWSKYTWGSWGS